jgi:hypothetical protein
MRLKVPGVNDVLPPEGRITFQLMDERGRIKHIVKCENLFMNQMREAMATQQRGQQNVSTGIGFDSTAAQAIGVDNDQIQYFGTIDSPRVYSSHQQMLRSLYLSSFNAPVNTNWWFPLGLQAGAHLSAVYSGTHTRRGTAVLLQSTRRPDGVRYCWDFGLDAANGFSIESAGLAGLTFTPDGDNYAYGWITPNVILPGSNGTPIGGCRIRGTAQTSANHQLWVIGEDGLNLLDFTLSTTWNTTAIRSLVGPTAATLGVADVYGSGIAIIGSSMWLCDALRLRKMDIPTSTAMPAVLNTYNPITGFTDAATVAMCTDGTNLYVLGSTKVFVVSPTTGAVTSSWAHGMTSVTSINYDVPQNVVWIVGIPAGMTYGPSSGPNGMSDMGSDNGSNNGRAPQPFTLTGTLLGYGIPPGQWGNPTPSFVTDTMWFMDGGRHIFQQTNNTSAGNFQNMSQCHGGCLGSRALVDTPFTKTASEVMRVFYDIAFSVPP